MNGKVCEADTMEPIDVMCTALTGLWFSWEIKQTCVLPQATEDDCFLSLAIRGSFNGIEVC